MLNNISTNSPTKLSEKTQPQLKLSQEQYLTKSHSTKKLKLKQKAEY